MIGLEAVKVSQGVSPAKLTSLPRVIHKGPITDDQLAEVITNQAPHVVCLTLLRALIERDSLAEATNQLGTLTMNSPAGLIDVLRTGVCLKPMFQLVKDILRMLSGPLDHVADRPDAD